MLGLAGIGYFYLRLYDSLVNPPVVIILPEEDLSTVGKRPTHKNRRDRTDRLK
jgi:hypothetical protein